MRTPDPSPEEVRELIKKAVKAIGGDPDKFNYSRKAGADKKTVSTGNLQKQRANYQNEKVYDKKEIVAAFGTVKSFVDMRKFAKNRQRC